MRMRRMYERPITELTDSIWTEDVLVSGSNSLEKYVKGADIQVGDLDEQTETNSTNSSLWEE